MLKEKIHNKVNSSNDLFCDCWREIPAYAAGVHTRSSIKESKNNFSGKKV